EPLGTNKVFSWNSSSSSSAGSGPTSESKPFGDVKVDSGRSLVHLQFALNGQHRLGRVAGFLRQTKAGHIGEDVTEVGSHAEARSQFGFDTKAVVIGEALLVGPQVTNAVNGGVCRIGASLVTESIGGQSDSTGDGKNQLR